MRSPSASDGPSPTVSIIVPTYDRPAQLAGCLDALAALEDAPAGFEVVVVDDGGRVSLEPVIASFQKRRRIVLLREAHAGPASARNAGAAQADGTFLVFLDDDCRPASGWLRALVRRLGTAGPHAVVGGRMRNALPHNIYSAAGHALVEAVDAYFNNDPAHARHLISANLALSREDFRAIGGFDATLETSEDRDLCDRCLEQGYALIIEPEAVVSHVRPLTLTAFLRQHFAYGRGTLDYHRRRARRGATPFTLDGPFYLHLLRYPFGRHPFRRALVLSILLGLAQTAKAAGLLWQWTRRSASPQRAREADVQSSSMRSGNAGDLAE